MTNRSLFDEVISGLTEFSGAIAAAGKRMSRDEYGLALAKAVSLRADCTRRRVGAVIIDKNNRVVGIGYNGAPPNKDGCLSNGACPRGTKSYAELSAGSPYVGDGVVACIALHAEENAILHSDRSAREGATIFITHEPCANCRRVLGGSGLWRVVYLTGNTEKHGEHKQYIIGDNS